MHLKPRQKWNQILDFSLFSITQLLNSLNLSDCAMVNGIIRQYNSFVNAAPQLKWDSRKIILIQIQHRHQHNHRLTSLLGCVDLKNLKLSADLWTEKKININECSKDFLLDLLGFIQKVIYTTNMEIHLVLYKILCLECFVPISCFVEGCSTLPHLFL